MVPYLKRVEFIEECNDYLNLVQGVEYDCVLLFLLN